MVSKFPLNGLDVFKQEVVGYIVNVCPPLKY